MERLSMAQLRALCTDNLYADPISLYAHIQDPHPWDRPITPETLAVILNRGFATLNREYNPKLDDGTIVDVRIPGPGGLEVSANRVWLTEKGRLARESQGSMIRSASGSKSVRRTRKTTLKLLPGDVIIVPVPNLPGVKEWRQVASITMDEDSMPEWDIATVDDRGHGWGALQHVKAPADHRWSVR